MTSYGSSRLANTEETGCCCDVAAFRYESVDGLSVLVDRTAQIPWPSGHFALGSIHESAVADAVSVRAGGIGDERGEALHPLVDGGVANVDAVLGEQFFDVAVGLAVPEVPADRQQDHVESEPEPSKRAENGRATSTHRSTP